MGYPNAVKAQVNRAYVMTADNRKDWRKPLPRKDWRKPLPRNHYRGARRNEMRRLHQELDHGSRRIDPAANLAFLKEARALFEILEKARIAMLRRRHFVEVAEAVEMARMKTRYYADPLNA